MGALSGTTALLLLAVFAVVNVACLVLRRDPPRESGFHSPTAIPVIGALACTYLLGPWARLEADMVQYRIAEGMLTVGVVLWVVTFLVNRATGTTSTFDDVDSLSE